LRKYVVDSPDLDSLHPLQVKNIFMPHGSVLLCGARHD
jgi:hypothetical protein